MTDKFKTVFNTLLVEGYDLLAVKVNNPHRHYILSNERTMCVVTITEDDILEVSLCLDKDVTNKSFASERNVTVRNAEDVIAACELIHQFENWCDKNKH